MSGRNSGMRVNSLHARKRVTSDGSVDFWARGQPETAPTGLSPGFADGVLPLNVRARISFNEEIIDLGGASSALSANNLLPANAIIFPIVTRPVRDFSTPTTYNIGDTTSNTRFGTALANDVVADGVAYAGAHWAGTVAIYQAAAGKVKITPNAAGTGLLHVSVPYISLLGGQK